MLIIMERIAPPDRKKQEINHAAFAVLRAARDLGDVAGQLTARAVIEAHLNHKQPRAADLDFVARYFV